MLNETARKGVRVDVEGTIVNGVSMLSKVKIETEDEQDDLEVEGAIASVSATTFVVHGVTVRVDANTLIVGGTMANLSVGARVEVDGVLAADGVTLAATKIEFKR